MVLLHLSICSSCLFTSLSLSLSLSLCDAALLPHPAQLARQLAQAQVRATQGLVARVWHIWIWGKGGREGRTHTHTHTHKFKRKDRDAKRLHPVDWSGGLIS